jgi:hypothetical protein
VIAVVWASLRAAPRRAAFLALLGAVACTVAVAVPAYVAAAERAVIAAEVAAAGPAESTITIRRSADTPEKRNDQSIERLLPARIAMPGFESIYGARFDAAPAGDGPAGWYLTYRDKVCDHVSLESGRCPVGRAEVMIGVGTAAELDLSIGTTVATSQIRWVPVDGDRVPVRVGPPVPLTVVGIYRPTAPRAPYWGAHPPFIGAEPFQPTMEPLFASRGTLRLFQLEVPEEQTYDIVARPGALTAEWATRHPAEIARVDAAATELNADVTAGTVPLMARIEDSRAAVRSLVPWLVLPLVPLCWYVVLLAAASGADARRTELGQLALRGVPAGQRYWLAAAPDALAVLVGAPVGALLGPIVGRLAAPGGAAGVPVDGAGRNALIAAAGAVAAVLLAYRSALTTRAVDLLRRVPSVNGAWRTAAAEVSVAALAVFAIVEGRAGSAAPRGGLNLLAPVLLVVLGALLAGRVLPLAARWIGRRALRQGRLSAALAGIELARRPAARRVMTLAVLGVALLCFAAIAADLGSAARTARAAVELGADRVLRVETVAGPELERAVRSADPEGGSAMAAVHLTVDARTPPVIAVDSERLAAIAASDLTPAKTSPLRPALPPTLTFDGDRVEVDATASKDGVATFDPPKLYAVYRFGTERKIDLGPLRPGRHTYGADVSSCSPACRFIGLDVEESSSQFDLTVHEIRQGGPDRPIADPATMSDPTRWRGTAVGDPTALRPSLTVGPDGAALRFRVSARTQRLAATDAPEYLPALATDSTPPGGSAQGWVVSAPSGEKVVAQAAGTVDALPGTGRSGLLVDIDVFDRMVPITAGGTTEVWLSEAAPPDIRDRLAAAGVRVVQEVRSTDAVSLADRHGVALAGRASYFAAGFALLLALLGLALVTGVERRERDAQAAVLRAQGVGRPVLAGAGRRRQLWPVAAALVAGPLVAVGAWVAARSSVPVFGDAGWPVPPPALVDPIALVAPWVVAAAALLVGAALSLSRRSTGGTGT